MSPYTTVAEPNLVLPQILHPLAPNPVEFLYPFFNMYANHSGATHSPLKKGGFTAVYFG
jgi:hypothetical protein